MSDLNNYTIAMPPSGNTIRKPPIARRRLRPLALTGALASVLVTAACGHRDQLDIDGPTHRLNYFIAKKSMKMLTQKYYQQFIEQEIGQNFTVGEFTRYMDRNGAVCERDPDNKITYCMYSTFGWMIDYDHPLTNDVEVAGLWCFWSIPISSPPFVNFAMTVPYFLHQSDVRDSKDYIRSHHLLSCREQLHKMGIKENE